MILYKYEIGEGYIISLADLSRRLTAISHGAHQWTVEIVQKRLLSGKGELQSYALIGYTNPVMLDMPNYLSFLFPIVVQREGKRNETGTFIWLHPSEAVDVAYGLYFEGVALKRDCLQDWMLFWSPLRESLITEPPEQFPLGSPTLSWRRCEQRNQ
jgi:hypothetical protein